MKGDLSFAQQASGTATEKTKTVKKVIIGYQYSRIYAGTNSNPLLGNIKLPDVNQIRFGLGPVVLRIAAPE